MVVSICRSSHRRCSVRKVVHKNFSKFTGKLLCQSLVFNKVAGLRLATLWKKRLWHRCFQVNVAKFLRTLSFTEHLWATAFVFGTTLTKHLAMSIVDKRREELYMRFITCLCSMFRYNEIFRAKFNVTPILMLRKLVWWSRGGFQNILEVLQSDISFGWVSRVSVRFQGK